MLVIKIHGEMSLKTDEFEKWKRKRRNTLIGYIIVGCLSGIDYTIVFATLYIYLEELVKTDHPNLYYGITIAAYTISSIFSSLIVSKKADKSRNIRYLTIVSLILQSLGNAVYIVNFSPLYVVMGRLIAGFGDFFRGIASGELSRIYDSQKCTPALWKFTTAYSLGAVIGPALGGTFQGIHFHIGSLTVTYLNFPGIVLCVSNILVIMVSVFLISDCSKEFDMKEHLNFKHKNDNDKLINSTQKSSNTEMQQATTKKVLTTFILNKNIALTMISTLVFGYSLYFIDIISPIIVMKTLKWNISVYSALWSANAVVYFFIMIAGSKICNSTKRTYWTIIICAIANMVSVSLITLMKTSTRLLWRDIMFMVLFQIPYSFMWLLEEVLFTSLLANMVKSNTQCFAESFRVGISKLGSLLAALTIPLAMPYFAEWNILLLVLMFVIIIIFISRKSSLINIFEG